MRRRGARWSKRCCAHGRYQVLDRRFTPNFLFGPEDVVIALGQDGLVANTMKYLDGQPLVGVNPDPGRCDGVLLPFSPRDMVMLLPEMLGRPPRAAAGDHGTGQPRERPVAARRQRPVHRPESHTSARYELRLGGAREVQSSSGVIVSPPGWAPPGWMTSVVTGALAVARHHGASWRDDVDPLAGLRMAWDAPQLRFAVREPFPSRPSQAGAVRADHEGGAAASCVSLMPEGGVIFSDGIESDYLEFGAGTTATIAVADKMGRLVV